MIDLQELATNALLDHWPPHLGVTTDAEKIAYLAEALGQITAKEAEIEDLENQIETLEDEAADLENKIDSRDDQIEKLETKVEELTDDNERLKDELRLAKGGDGE
jgi:predicted nuclease with TOPRIM domain